MADDKEKKEKNKVGLFSTIRSLGEPELQKFAESIADLIPEDSFLRSETAHRVVGYLKTWVENKAKSIPGVKGDLLETLTDLVDFSGLYSKKRGEKGEKAAKVVKDWMDQFFTESGKRLREAKTIQEKEAELLMIKKEFELRQELLTLIEAAKPKPEPEKEKKPFISSEMEEKIKGATGWLNKKNENMLKEIQILKREVENG